MRDAETPHRFAGIVREALHDDHGMEIFRPFHGERGPNVEQRSGVRVTSMTCSRTRLTANPSSKWCIGCGFDSRAFRLKGGVVIELDDPSSSPYRTNVCSGEGTQSIRRIAIDFGKNRFRKSCNRMRRRADVFVLEG